MRFTLPFAMIAMFTAGMQVAAQAPGTCRLDLSPGATAATAASAESLLNTVISIPGVLGIVQDSAVCTTASGCVIMLTPNADITDVLTFLRALNIANVVASTASCTPV